jgi:molybdopterin-guanine dinucleotide biosynthesis protein A
MLVNKIDNLSDIVVPASGTYFQPLCAVYSKRTIPYIEGSLSKGDIKTDRIYEKLRVKKVPYISLQTVDPELESFFNVNTPEDLESAKTILSRREKI